MIEQKSNPMSKCWAVVQSNWAHLFPSVLTVSTIFFIFHFKIYCSFILHGKKHITLESASWNLTFFNLMLLFFFFKGDVVPHCMTISPSACSQQLIKPIAGWTFTAASIQQTIVWASISHTKESTQQCLASCGLVKTCSQWILTYLEEAKCLIWIWKQNNREGKAFSDWTRLILGSYWETKDR